MYIKSLHLVNIRSYVEQTLQFSKGTILLSGDIGSGKSTVLQAIEFALFGIIRNELTGTSLLRHDAKKGLVKLTIVLEGTEYTFMRGLSRSKTTVSQSTGSIESDGAVEELSANELTTRIFALFAYPTHYTHKSQSLLYRYTVYTSQERMKEILFEQVETRLQTLRALFGVEKYKTISANAQLVAKELRLKKAFLEGQLQALPQLAEKKSELLENIAQHTTQSEQLQTQLTQQQTELDMKTKSQAELQAQVQSQQEMQQKISLLQSQRTQLSEQISAYEVKQKTTQTQLEKIATQLTEYAQVTAQIDLSQLQQRKDELQQKISTVKQKAIEVTTRKKALETQVAQLQKQLATKDETQSQLSQLKEQVVSAASLLEAQSTKQTQVTEFEQALSSLTQKQATISARVAQLTESLDNMTDADTCPVCQQNITQDHKLHTREEFTVKITADKQMLTVSDKTKQKLEANLAALKVELKELEQKQANQNLVTQKIEMVTKSVAQFSELTTQLEATQKELTELVLPDGKESELLGEELAKLDAQIKQAQLVNEKFAKREKLVLEQSHLQKSQTEVVESVAKIKSQLEQLANQQKEISFSTEAFAQLQAELTQVAQTVAQVTHQVQVTQNELTKVKTQLELFAKSQQDVLNQMIELQKHEKAMSKMATYNSWIKDSFVPLMGTLERAVFTSAYQECQQAFAKWFSILMPDESITAQLDAQFTPIITQDGYETSLENLSGGEKTSIALVYRLALNHVINQVVTTIKTKDLLILDEPTDGFSLEQLDRVKDVLDQLQLEQLIIVSHEQKVESFVDTIIRITKQNHVSVVQQL